MRLPTNRKMKELVWSYSAFKWQPGFELSEHMLLIRMFSPLYKMKFYIGFSDKASSSFIYLSLLLALILGLNLLDHWFRNASHLQRSDHMGIFFPSLTELKIISFLCTWKLLTHFLRYLRLAIYKTYHICRTSFLTVLYTIEPKAFQNNHLQLESIFEKID